MMVMVDGGEGGWRRRVLPMEALWLWRGRWRLGAMGCGASGLALAV